MATRLKTVQFSSPTYRSVVPDAVETLTNSGSIYMPENSIDTPITIKSFTIDIGWQDVITATGGTITEHRCALTLGSAEQNTIIETDDIANTGENMGGVVGPWDFTSYAISNLGTNTSQSYEIRVFFDQNTGTTLGMNNISALITMTYEYDDTSPTQIKTVWIPFDSISGSLPTTEREIGINQIPALGTFLPETNKIIRDYFFQIEGNQQTTSATDITVSFKIDDEAQHDTGFQERALASDIFTRYIWNRKSDYPDTGSVHAFKAWANIPCYNNLTYTMVVTYEFDATTTTASLNSIYIPMEMGSPLGLESGYPSRFKRDVIIQEPGAITLKHSAFRLNYNAAAPVAGLNVRMGNQSYRSYADNGNQVCGMLCLQQRIDSGAIMGSYGTFSKGRNTFIFEGYRTDTVDDPTNLNGYILLNYISDIATDGIGSHSHTVFYNMFQWDALATDRLIIPSFSIILPETNHWIVSLGIVSIIWDGVSANAFSMGAEVRENESKGGGYIDLYSDAVQSDPERRCSILWMRGGDVFKRFPGDIDNERLNVELPRSYRFFTPASTQQGLYFFITYHSIYYPLTGSVSNYSGDGSGININVFRAYNDEKIMTLTTTSNGQFTGSWYDNTEALYCVAREDNNHVGRSGNGVV
jgi:hypothetical protein